MNSFVPVFFRSCLSVAAVSFSASVARADDLFLEAFDSEEEAKVEAIIGADMTVTYVDYSAMLVGETEHSIPEAPRQIPGSAPTRGVLFQSPYSNQVDPYGRLANLAAVDEPFGSRLYFEDNYRLKFDAYLCVPPSVTLGASGIPNEVGTTEHVLWGVGYNQTSVMGRGWRTGRGDGVWGWLSGEGGFGSATGADASLWRKNVLMGGRDMSSTSPDLTYFTPAFGEDASPVPNAPANQWVQVDITVSGKRVTVEYGAVGRTMTKFFDNVPGTIIEGEGDEAVEISYLTGTVMVGYEDAATSASFDPDNQWLLIDNLVVEDLTPPSLLVQQVAPLVSYTGTPTTTTYAITNGRATGDLSVTAVNLTGADAAAFAVTTPLPLVIPAGQVGNLTLSFDPAEPDGLKTAEATLVLDDPGQPTYSLGVLSARRSIGSFFMAHYKLDEAEGATLANAVEGGPNGGLQVRDPVLYRQPSLLGAGDPGTALGFTPANSSTSGNYFSTLLTNTPTYSLSLWAKPAPGGSERTLFQRHPDYTAPNDRLYALVLDPAGALKYRVNFEEAPFEEVFIDDEEVSHLVVTHLDEDGFGNTTATRIRLYVNGEMVGELEGEGTPGFDDYPLSAIVTSLHIGSRTAAGFGYAGDLDDIQVYGAELTPEQVRSLYQNPGSTAADPPVTSPVPLEILSVQYPAESGPFGITFASEAGATYTLQRTSSLADTEWAAVGEPITGVAGQTTLEDPAPPAGSQFYRVARGD